MSPQPRSLVRGRLRTLDPERPEVDAVLLEGAAWLRSAPAR